MALNRHLDRWAHAVVRSVKKKVYPSNSNQSNPGSADNAGTSNAVPNESTPLHTISKATQASVEIGSPPLSTTGTQTLNHEDSVDAVNTNNTHNNANTQQNGHIMDVIDSSEGDEDDDDTPMYPWQRPKGILASIWWLCFFPLNLLFFITIPDVRRKKCVNLFPLAFIMSVVWIGAISYEVTWLITVIGYTISVPDTVMGLSFLAVGTSIPEVFSSLIVSRQVCTNVASSTSFLYSFKSSNDRSMIMYLGSLEKAVHVYQQMGIDLLQK